MARANFNRGTSLRITAATGLFGPYLESSETTEFDQAVVADGVGEELEEELYQVPCLLLRKSALGVQDFRKIGFGHTVGVYGRSRFGRKAAAAATAPYCRMVTSKWRGSASSRVPKAAFT